MPSPAASGPDTNAQTEVFAEVSPFLIEPPIPFQFKAVSAVELDAFFLQQAPLEGVAIIAGWGI